MSFWLARVCGFADDPVGFSVDVAVVNGWVVEEDLTEAGRKSLARFRERLKVQPPGLGAS